MPIEPSVTDRSHHLDMGLTNIRAIRAVNRASALAAIVKLIHLVPDLSADDLAALGRYVHERMAAYAAFEPRWDFSQKESYAADTVKGVLALAQVTR